MEQQVIHQSGLLEYVPKTSIVIISMGRIISIPITTITHISKSGSTTIIYTTDVSHKTFLSLQELLNDLPVNDFFRVHRSHIMALKYMNGMRRKRIRVGNYDLPVSKYYKYRLINRLQMLIDRDLVFFFNRDFKS
jgi:DNA-binding LytR/AlgR family response regulator